MPFDGLRVLAFESRRANEMAELIRRQGGDPFVAPAVREAPIENNRQVLAFGERLFRGEFDMLILLTGTGTRALNQALGSQFADALRKITVVARGPKPAAVLREMGVPVTVMVPEPNTWRELLTSIDGRPEKRIAVQEYGRSNPDLLEGLRARGAEVTPVPVYRWDLPKDMGPLRQAAARIEQNQADVVMFTASIQAVHLFQAGGPGLREALQRTVIASIGPTTSETLEDLGLQPDLEPSRPKMGFLVKETADRAAAILARKRQSHG